MGPVNGNVTKFDSYREAWARIKLSQDEGFYLEAIAIEESILTDRLVSFLTRPDCQTPIKKNNKGRYPSFGNLIKLLSDDIGEPLAIGEFEDICVSLDEWREKRNQAVHALVASDPGSPTIPVDAFLNEAKEAADLGAELAMAVSGWHKAAKGK